MKAVPATSPPVRRSGWKRALRIVLQLAILLLVVWGIWRTVHDAAAKFEAADFSPTQLHLGWLTLAAVFYAAGMLPSCLFWRRTLHAMGQYPDWLPTLRAFYIGHLGKYVPGKALVVILRTVLIRGPRVDTAVAATSVFVETLTMMAVGAALAAAVLALLFREHAALLGLALLLACFAGVPTWPPLFRRLVRWMQFRRAVPQLDQAVAGLNLPLMLYGWLTITAGWVLFGLSLWATLRAIPQTEAGGFLLHLPLLTACVALAVVAGFLSMLPGGVGVRELVVMTLLAPVFGEVVAIVSAITLRVVWLGAELVVAGALYLLPARQAPVPQGEL